MNLYRFALSAGFAVLGGLPSAALAQSDLCYQLASDVCGDLTYGQCFATASDWDMIPANCHGDVQAQIEMDREFEANAGVGSQDPGATSSDICYAQAADLCGTLALGDCFQSQDNWNYIDTACHGDIQRQIEMDREATEQFAAEIGSGGYVTGMAWGGKMRDGPGMNYRQIDSMTEGEGIEIVADTGEWYNDFQWYEVIAHGRQGFVWGGNFCHDGGGHMDGSGGACN